MLAGCPDSETLAAYLDGQLFPEQRERLEEHLAGCDPCATVVADVLRATGAGVATPRYPHGGLAAVAALAVAVTAGSLWLTVGIGWHPWRGAPRAPLVAATADARPFVPRLTGGFHWAPPVETLRGATMGATSSDSWRFFAAAEKVRQAAEALPNADRLGALADAQLVVGDADQAVATLARAIAADPTDPHLLSDLAAAHLARAQSGGDAAEYATAVELSSQALAAIPGLPEAAFNRALALEGLKLPGEARRAWQSYLDAETDADWRAEARQHADSLSGDEAPSQRATLEALRQAAEDDGPELPELVAAHRWAARRLVERDLLPAWGSAVLAGDEPRAVRELAAAKAIARVCASQTGDMRLRGELDEVSQAVGSLRLRLAKAHRDLAQGETLFDAMEREAALGELRRAARLFPPRTVGARRTTLELLVSEFSIHGSTDAMVAATDQRLAQSGDDPATRGRALWLRGLLAAYRGQAGAAAGFYLEALDQFGRLKEVDSTAWLHFLLSEAYMLAGDQRSAWRHRAAAIAAVPSMDDTQRGNDILLQSGTWCLLAGQPHLASALLDERSARSRPGSPFDRAELALQQAQLQWHLGNRRGVARSISSVAAQVLAVPDPTARSQLAAALAALRGATAESPEIAVTALSSALRTFRTRELLPPVPGLLLQRARAYRRQGQLGAAERDLREGIADLEQGPPQGSRSEIWLDRLVEASPLYDEMTSLALDMGRPDEAFTWVERARAHALRFTGGEPRTPAPASLAGLSHQLEPGTTLLSYALIGERSLVWRVDRQGARLLRLPVKPSDVRSWVAVLDADLAAGEWSQQSRATAAKLYRALIAPAGIEPRSGRLVIVPDRTLAALPFAALVDSDGHYLLEAHTIEMAPSASGFARAHQRWRELAAEQASALVLGDPRTDTVLFRQLTQLPGAAEEARQVAATYADATLLTGSHATREALLAEIGEHAVVHLATHALVNDTNPPRSMLALAPRRSGDGSGALYAQEIPLLALPQTRTVVLATCGGSGLREGVDARLSLARAFLAADVPTVVATLWPVGDRRSVPLLVGLHSRLGAGDDPPTALRAAQLALLHRRDPTLSSPATWALFQALGG